VTNVSKLEMELPHAPLGGTGRFTRWAELRWACVLDGEQGQFCLRSISHPSTFPLAQDWG